jgi:potassium-transporting ATPase KdpC subunit
MFKEISASLKLCVVTIAICAVAYPIVVFGFAAAAAPNKRLGSLVADSNGQVIGSRLIAQPFTRAEYFWPRPSACDYNAAAASGSNLSPANPALRQAASERIDRLAPNNGEVVPADLVTASGSGLDPDISYAAALFQAPRVARARGVSLREVLRLVDEHAKRLSLSSDMESRMVNVLELNLTLDASKE